MSWDESKHPRDDEGKFTDGTGRTALKESALSFQDGLIVNGIKYMRTKFQPCESCLLLRYKEEVA